MTRVRRAGLTLLVFLLCACGGTCGASTPAAKPTSSGDVLAAQVQGAWDLTVTLDSYTGPSAQHFIPAGHKGVDRVWFQSQCPTSGHCTLEMWGPSGPDPQTQAFFQFYGKTTGLQGPPVSIPMQQSGDSYSAEVPIGGSGGQIPCRPPQGVAAPTQHLTLRVTTAVSSASGWSASSIVGTETVESLWGCNGATFTGWVIAHIAITGHPTQV